MRLHDAKAHLAIIAKLLDHVLEAIRPIESFPAHVCDDLIYLAIDTNLMLATKAAVNKASELTELVSIQSAMFHKCKLKLMLAASASDRDVAAAIVDCAGSSAGLLHLIEIVRKNKGADTVRECVQALASVDLRSFTKETQSEIVELQVLEACHSPLRMRAYLEQNLPLLTVESSQSLQKHLIESAEAAFLQKDYDQSLGQFRCAGMLMSGKSEVNQHNAPIVSRKVVMCLLALGRLDEAEETVLMLPFDLHGLTLRFYLAVLLHNRADSSQFLDRIQSSDGCTVNHLLGVANYCVANRSTETLLRVLQLVIGRFGREDLPPKLKLDVLRSAISATVQVIPQADLARKAQMLLEYYDKALPLVLLEDFVDDIDYYFKLAWNTAAECLKNALHLEAAQLFYVGLMLLNTGHWVGTPVLSQTKITTITACLTAICSQPSAGPLTGMSAVIWGEKHKLLADAQSLMEDVEITSIYLPPTKRAKTEQRLKDIDLPLAFDSVRATKALDILALQLNALEQRWEECTGAIETLAMSADAADLERLALWCVERNQSIDTKVVLAVLQTLAEKVIHSPAGVDMLKFSFIYRGMSIAALSSPDSSYAYFQQALGLVKTNTDYPKEEVCWLAVASYNHALSVARLSADQARRWCELSLALCHHAGPFRQAYEATIRAGYSRILERLA